MTAPSQPPAETAVVAGVAATARNGRHSELQRAEDFTSSVLEIVESIPEGHVMSYGDVAAVLGSRAPRAVGQIMAYFGSDVPWWRVVRASGLPAQGHEDAALPHYEAEGTPLVPTASGYRINLRLARYRP